MTPETKFQRLLNREDTGELLKELESALHNEYYWTHKEEKERAGTAVVDVPIDS